VHRVPYGPVDSGLDGAVGVRGRANAVADGIADSSADAGMRARHSHMDPDCVSDGVSDDGVADLESDQRFGLGYHL
jgi:hypothetical protein